MILLTQPSQRQHALETGKSVKHASHGGLSLVDEREKVRQRKRNDSKECET